MLVHTRRPRDQLLSLPSPYDNFYHKTLLFGQHRQPHSIPAVSIQHLGGPAANPFSKCRHTTKHSFFPWFFSMHITTISVTGKCSRGLSTLRFKIFSFSRDRQKCRTNRQATGFVLTLWTSVSELRPVGPWYGFALCWDAFHHQNRRLLPQSRVLTAMPACTQSRTPSSCGT